MNPTDLQQHQHWMHQAISLSQYGMENNFGGPFGAVIVKNQQIIGSGWNQVTSTNDPTAHAEICAIRNACNTLNTFSLQGASIYTSCEPCPMCLAAIYWARLDTIYYANSRADAAAIHFDDQFLYHQISLPAERRSIPMIRISAESAKTVFTNWLKKPDRIPY